MSSFVERYLCNVDVEHLDGTIEKDLMLFRNEMLAIDDDIESVYEREYVVRDKENDTTEYYVGNDKGENIIVKERKENG